MKELRAAAITTLFTILATTAMAVPITFTHMGSGSGSLAGDAFNSSFTITAVGDTDDRMAHSSGFSIDHTSAMIDIVNVGTFSFITDTRTFVNNDTNIVGFSRASIGGSDLFNGPTDAAAFSSWDMLSGIGPISGLASLLQWTSSSSPVSTSGGQLEFDNLVTDARFTATLGSDPIPEPGTILLLGSGLVGLAGVGRKRRE